MKKTELEKRLEAEAAQKEANVATETAAAPPDVDVAALLAERDALLTERDALLAERDTQKDQFLRARADFDNFRKRMLREMEQVRRTAAERLVSDILPVVDNLERAIEHTQAAPEGLLEGVNMVLKQFHDVLGRHGVETVPAVGLPFDPTCHDAVACIETEDCPPDHVAQEMLKGYRIGGTILRPAKVLVSKAVTEQPVPEENLEPCTE